MTLTHCPLENHDAIFEIVKPCLLIDTFRSFYENALRSMAWGLTDNHYNDVIMGTMASQITGVSIVYLTVSSGADQNKTLKFRVTGLCAGNSPVTGKFLAQSASNAENFPFDDVIIKSTLDQLMA